MDLNGNGIAGDAGDLVLMKRAALGEIPADSRFDLNLNLENADAGDLLLMKKGALALLVSVASAHPKATGFGVNDTTGDRQKVNYFIQTSVNAVISFYYLIPYLTETSGTSDTIVASQQVRLYADPGSFSTFFIFFFL